MNIKKLCLNLFIFVFLLVSVFIFSNRAQAQVGTELTGWAWSSNVGWISFNCSNMGTCASNPYKVAIVKLPSGLGYLTGYAWSDHVGWISFLAGGVDPTNMNGCPTNPCRNSINLSTGEVTGWAKAIQMKGDGWIELSGTNHDSNSAKNTNADCSNNCGGVFYDKASATKTLKGFAFGNIGWIHFDIAESDTPCKIIAGQCTTAPDPKCTITSLVQNTAGNNVTVYYNIKYGDNKVFYPFRTGPTPYSFSDIMVNNDDQNGNFTDNSTTVDLTHVYKIATTTTHASYICTGSIKPTPDTTGLITLWLKNNQDIRSAKIKRGASIDINWNTPVSITPDSCIGKAKKSAQTTHLPGWTDVSPLPNNSDNNSPYNQTFVSSVNAVYKLWLECTSNVDGLTRSSNEVTVTVSDSTIGER